MTDRSATALCLTVVLACLAGCKKPDEIRHYTVPKQEAIDQLAGAAEAPAGPTRILAAAVLQPRQAWFFKLVGPDEAVAAQREPFNAFVKSLRFSDSDSPPDWTLPEGWSQRPASGMRYATLTIDSDPPLEVSITTLGREGGGEAAYLLANINRWRGQIGLADLAPDQLEEQTEQVEYEGGKATLVNLVGQLKPGGPMRSGGAGDAPFAPFASGGSRKPSGPSPLDHAVTPQGAAGGAPDLHYEVPEGWKEEPASGFRLASFQVSDGGKKAEITVVTAGGDLLANVNRWRGQIGLDPTTQAELDRDAQPIDVGELQGQYVELTGPKKTTLAVVVQAAGRTWFTTLKGDNELAQRETENFKTFVHSLSIGQPKG